MCFKKKNLKDELGNFFLFVLGFSFLDAPSDRVRLTVGGAENDVLWAGRSEWASAPPRTSSTSDAKKRNMLEALSRRRLHTGSIYFFFFCIESTGLKRFKLFVFYHEP